ncbi:S8 family serine peptidase [Streptomyces palmae]|uniref:S8 family serine peptidase n=1 Tax=Streptomyces palmae TaxID=1701085 RepID=UPI001FD79B0B|nr:S8 family serine peptidase [Streptomyces palmae]
MAAAAAVALAAGLTTAPAASAQDQSTTGAPEARGARAGAAKHWITLITGDRVAVDGKGRTVGLRRAEGREHIPVQIQRVNGHTYALPLDARRLIGQGRLDQRLFDLTTLSRPEYLARQREGLRLIVTYRGERPAAKSALRAAGGTEVRHTFRSLGADAVGVPAQDAGAAWKALTGAPEPGTPYRTAASGVAAIWLDGIRRADLDKSVPQIGAPEAWKAGYDGKGSTIAVLDTGVDETHPDLAGQQIEEKNFSEARDTKDRVGHGTHVASIAAGTGAKSGGKYKGVAPGARILDGKVLDDAGFGDDSGVLAGMEWAVAKKADVVNLSLGGPDSPGKDPLEAAVDKLSAETGTLFVISAGNEGESGPGSIGSPGSADSALTVGAVDKRDKLADFSSTGPRVGDDAIKPDVTAPGVDIGAAAAPGSLIAEEGTPVADGYVAISGTSMAAPHSAGAAAIIAQQHPDWTGGQIKSALIGTSTPGDGYSAFQQGTGRIDLRKAITTSLIAEQPSLSYGLQSWPHTDDKPVTKELTYRNLGDQPVTLDLSVVGTGPDRRPAPDGFFTVKDKQLTVPAKGTASTTVTTNTKLGGSVDGAYSAYVTATGGGQSVRTAAAVNREVESYDVTLKHLGRDGKPAKYFLTDLTGLTGQARGVGHGFDETTKNSTVRLPKGRYVLSSQILPVGLDDYKGMDWINQPRLEVTKKTTVTLDARTTKPVDVTGPDSRARAAFADVAMDVTLPDGGGYSSIITVPSFKNFRTAHLGPAAPRGELSQQYSAVFRRGSDGPEYHLAYGGPTTRMATGLTRHAKYADLAKVTATLGSSAAKKSGLLSVSPDTGGGVSGSVLSPVKLPRTSTLYLTGKGATWEFDFIQMNDQGPFEAGVYAAPARFTPGSSYQRRFNIGVFGPGLPADSGIFRDGDKLGGSLPLFTDGAGNSGWSNLAKVTTTLYRNGSKVGSNEDPLSGEPFTVPADRAGYKLTTSVSRSSKVAKVSTRIDGTWTFSSGHTDGKVRLPASVVRFTPALAADSTAKAGATMRVPVAVKGSAAGGHLKSLTVYVSYDEGKHWKKLAVSSGKVTVKNPRAGGSVSFRAEAADKQGNTVSQTIYRAYLTK